MRLAVTALAVVLALSSVQNAYAVTELAYENGAWGSARALRPSNGVPFVGGPVTPFVLNIDLRTLVGGAPGEPSVLVSNGPFSTPIVSFDGIDGFTSSAPVPDTNGAVGPRHYIQSVNGKFAIFDKTGTMLLNPFTYFELWEAAQTGDECESANIDPIVLYDHLADRWLISATRFTNECIAISRTPDPIAGGWFLYNFPCPESGGSGVCDYSKLGVWPDAYYMSTHWSPPPGLAWAFDRTNMLLGNPAIFIHFGYSEPPSFNTFMLPSDLKGHPPPAGAPNVFLRFVDGADPIQGLDGVDRLELSELHVDFSNPLLSTFTALPDLPTAPFDSNVCADWNNRVCITQPGTIQKVDSKSEMPMYPLVYRNFGTHETLIVSHAVKVAETVGMRWYELRKVGGVWFIFQQGDYSPDATNRWMGSMSMDKAGNIALGYSVSNSTVFPGIRYTGRLQSDLVGTMPQGEFTLIVGGSSQISSERWGDYSAMQVDPVDGCTFWYTNQYYSADYIDWRTRIAAFRFTECGIVTTKTTATTKTTTETTAATTKPVSVATAGNPVGGFVEPVSKLAVFAPYLVLFGVLAVMVIAAAPWKRRGNWPGHA